MSAPTAGAGPASTGWRDRYAAALMNTFGPPKLILERGEGTHVWDADGREYVDLLGGIAVNTLGHNHPALVDAVCHQLRTLGHTSNFFATRPQVRLAERLLALLGGEEHPAEGRVFLASSGSEANEAAFKLTRRTGRTKVVAMEGGFHGRTMGSLALTSKEAYRAPFEPLPGGVEFVPFGDHDALRAAVDGDTAAVVLEPVQGEAGVVEPADGFLRAARQATAEHGALLWLDEVQSGMGRTGAWFAHAASGVVPDVVTLAKGMAGGIPIGACIALGEAGHLFEPGNHGTTFGGNPVACAAALAVIETIESDGLMPHAVALGERLKSGLGADERVVEARGLGVLIGLDLRSEGAAAVVSAAQEAGWIINMTGPARIRLAPPLVLTMEDADAFVAAWPGILDAAGL